MGPSAATVAAWAGVSRWSPTRPEANTVSTSTASAVVYTR